MRRGVTVSGDIKEIIRSRGMRPGVGGGAQETSAHPRVYTNMDGAQSALKSGQMSVAVMGQYVA